MLIGSLIALAVVSVMLFRSLQNEQKYIDDVEIIRNSIINLHTACTDIVNKELYTNDPVVVAFISCIRQLDADVKFLNLLPES